MGQEGLNGHFMLLRTLWNLLQEVAGAPNLQEALLWLALTTLSGYTLRVVYSAGFLHWQFLCLLIRIAGLSPLKIPYLESLVAFVKMRPKYLIESSSSAQTGSAIYVWRVTSASLAASHREPEPAQADVPRCQQRRELSGWVRAFCLRGKPWPRLLQTPQLLEAGGVLVISSKRQAVGEHFLCCRLITAMLILKQWGRAGRW